MSKVTEAAENALETIEDRYPFRLNRTTETGVEPVIGTIRDNDGYPVIMPHPESVSMLTGDEAMFSFLVAAPQLIRDLLDEIGSKTD